MANILVTGGAGFIGSHTVVELAAAGHRPIIVDNLSNSERFVIDNVIKLSGKPVPFYEQDFQDIGKLREVLKTEAIDGLIHFAAFKQVAESVAQPLKYYDNNVNGLVELLKFVKTTSIQHIVFSSSCTVYGNPDSLPVSEDSPVKPAESPYGASKQMDETILRDAIRASTDCNALALRYFDPIGAHPSALIGELPKGIPANLVPFVTQTAMGLRSKLMVHGNDYATADGSCVRDYIHVVDLAKAHVRAIEYLQTQPAQLYDVVNIGTGKRSSVLEVIQTFEEVTGRPLPYSIGPRRAGDVVSTYASVAKAEKLLSWQAEKDLSEALRDAWRWQQTL